jgi:hypothetical protein
MMKLNLPEATFTFRELNEKKQIFDRFRKKYISLTPEEWVRQNFLCWLASEKKFPLSLIAVERELNLNEMKKRYDAVIYNTLHQPIMLIEFKSPDIKILQPAFEQAARYNLILKVPYLVVSNGMQHFCCRIDPYNGAINFLKDIPIYYELKF